MTEADTRELKSFLDADHVLCFQEQRQRKINHEVSMEIIDSFVAKLEAMKPGGVEWQYAVKRNEDHRSVMAVIRRD